jgi:hypothetical protein
MRFWAVLTPQIQLNEDILRLNLWVGPAVLRCFLQHRRPLAEPTVSMPAGCKLNFRAIDTQIGARLRQRRTELGISQKAPRRGSRRQLSANPQIRERR